MEQHLTVTKGVIEWQIPHEQNGDILANGGDVSALYASVDKGTPPVPSQNFLELLRDRFQRSFIECLC